MTKREFALKDSRGNYVGVNSISYDAPTRQYIYSSSPQLVNGYYTYTNEDDALHDLHILQEKGMKIKFVIKFHVDKINMLELVINEKMKGIVTCPFVHEVIEGWMILDKDLKVKNLPTKVDCKVMCGVGMGI